MSKCFCSRRDFLFQSGGGISGLALAYLLNQDGLLASPASSDACNGPAAEGNPFAVKSPHFKPRAKAIISLFMSGGVSQVDTFDPKPALDRYAGQPLAGKGPQWAVECGAAHGALAMTTPGDTSMATLSEVLGVMKGGGARVSR